MKFGKLGLIATLTLMSAQVVYADETAAPATPDNEYTCILHVSNATTREQVQHLEDFPIEIGTSDKVVLIPGLEERAQITLMKEEVAPGHFEAVYELQITKGTEETNDLHRLAMALRIGGDFMKFEHLSTYSESTNLFYSLSCRNYN